MKRSELQEKLVALYLRLNGYFTTGLIIHSPNTKEVEGEIDIIGVRFKGHRQPDREIECSPNLMIPDESEIDIIIGEVKGKKTSLQFNESLRLHPSRVKKLFDWIGCVEYDNDLIDKFTKIITPKEIQNSSSFDTLTKNNLSIRPILFAPDRKPPRNNQVRFIHGNEIINYCWNCFRPDNQRDECSTDYKAINNWGEQFEQLLGYFKNQDKKDSGDISDLYTHFKITD